MPRSVLSRTSSRAGLEKNRGVYNNIQKIRRKKYTLVVIRIADGQLVESKPCARCCRWIKLFGIGRVIYSDENGQLVTTSATALENDYVTSGFSGWS